MSQVHLLHAPGTDTGTPSLPTCPYLGYCLFFVAEHDDHHIAKLRELKGQRGTHSPEL
jgi:hypothetical protein